MVTIVSQVTHDIYKAKGAPKTKLGVWTIT